jgi:hypothetical protein
MTAAFGSAGEQLRSVLSTALTKICMKCFLSIAVFTLICAVHLSAADVTVEAVTAEDKDSEPTDLFSADVAKIYAFFKSKGSTKGDKFRGVFIAEDVGDAAPANTKIDEATVTADKEDATGSFSLSKPDNGWPVGKYRVDIYVGDSDKPATSVKFDIEEAAKSGDSSSEDQGSE